MNQGKLASIVGGTMALTLGAAAACSSNNAGSFGGDNGTGDDGSAGGSSSSGGPGASSGSSSGSTGASSGSSGASPGSSGGGAPDGAAGSDAGGAPEAGADAGQNATGTSGIVPDGDAGACPAPAGITANQTTALQIINQTRAAMGSPCATEVPDLDTSATKHCAYYAANAASTSTASCIANPHVEVSTCADYVSANFGDRETAAGYTCMPSLTQSCEASEVMAFDDNPTTALGQWIGSIYHRSPLLDPRMRDFGYGSATACDTIDLGEGAGSTTPDDVIVSYPYGGQTGVALSFNGQQESPTPPVPPGGWPSALPIHVYMAATSITLTTDEFGVDGGAQLAHQVLTPQASGGYLVNALVLYGNAPLTSQTTYRVHVAGTRMNQGYRSTTSAQFDVSFAFTTK
jgi:uncharacterized protein YkwD